MDYVIVIHGEIQAEDNLAWPVECVSLWQRTDRVGQHQTGLRDDQPSPILGPSHSRPVKTLLSLCDKQQLRLRALNKNSTIKLLIVSTVNLQLQIRLTLLTHSKCNFESDATTWTPVKEYDPVKNLLCSMKITNLLAFSLSVPIIETGMVLHFIEKFEPG